MMGAALLNNIRFFRPGKPIKVDSNKGWMSGQIFPPFKTAEGIPLNGGFL